jgi:putative transcription factor
LPFKLPAFELHNLFILSGLILFSSSIISWEADNMLCEMCSSPNVFYKVDIEGSRLNVCEKCASFGKIISKIAPALKVEKKHASKQVSTAAGSAPALKETETV